MRIFSSRALRVGIIASLIAALLLNTVGVRADSYTYPFTADMEGWLSVTQPAPNHDASEGWSNADGHDANGAITGSGNKATACGNHECYLVFHIQRYVTNTASSGDSFAFYWKYNGADTVNIYRQIELFYTDSTSSSCGLSVVNNAAQNSWDYFSCTSSVSGKTISHVDFSLIVYTTETTGIYTFWMDDGEINLLAAPGTPTPTPTPTNTPTPNGMTATPVPQATQFCLTATATPAANATATPRFTPTPYSLTPTPGPTATPIAPGSGYFVSDLATFSSSLSPWTNGPNGTTFTLENPDDFSAYYTSAVGYNGSAGAAFFHDELNILGGGELFTHTSSIRGALIYPRELGIPFPIRVQGWAKASNTLYATDTVKIDALYLDPDYYGAGYPAWVWIPGTAQMIGHANWYSFDFQIITATGGSGRAVALALTDSYLASQAGGVLVDDVRIFGGSLAVYGATVVCGTDGAVGNVSYTPRPVKECLVQTISADVYTCPSPNNFLNVGEWISYLWCNILKFLGFDTKNLEQLQALHTRQSNTEPIGTVLEITDASPLVPDALLQYSDKHYLHAERRATDWSTLLDFNAITNFRWPELSLASTDTTLTICDLGELESLNLSPEMRVGACATYNTINRIPAIQIGVQLLLDLSGMMLVFLYISSTWMSGGTSE